LLARRPRPGAALAAARQDLPYWRRGRRNAIVSAQLESGAWEQLASALGKLGAEAEASAAAAELLRVSPNYKLRDTRRAVLLQFRNPEDAERLLDGLRKAGLPE
jgi:hypothetical protein